MPGIPKVLFKSSRQWTRTLPIELIELGALSERRDRLNHRPELPHRVDFHLLIHVRKGSGRHFIDFETLHYEAGSFIFVGKGQVHAFDFGSNPEGTVVLFTDDFIEVLQRNMRTPWMKPHFPVLTPQPELEKRCAGLLSEIQTEVSEVQNDLLITMFLFSSVLLLLNRAAQEVSRFEPSDRNRKRFREFQALLQTAHTRTREASAYSSALNMTYKTLNQVCKKNTGKTAKQLIDNHVILEAKRRLILDKSSVQELAFDLGFDDTSNFVKYFSRHSGETPASFREKHKG